MERVRLTFESKLQLDRDEIERAGEYFVAVDEADGQLLEWLERAQEWRSAAAAEKNGTRRRSYLHLARHATLAAIRNYAAVHLTRADELLVSVDELLVECAHQYPQKEGPKKKHPDRLLGFLAAAIELRIVGKRRYRGSGNRKDACSTVYDKVPDELKEMFPDLDLSHALDDARSATSGNLRAHFRNALSEARERFPNPDDREAASDYLIAEIVDWYRS